MKVVALISGGKDSCYAMMKCIEYGHQIVALANLLPLDDSVDELDSYMYQTVGHQIILKYADCMKLPLFRRRIHGKSSYQELNYMRTPGDEVEDLMVLLTEVKKHFPDITGVSSGAIASDYQRLRVESVCSRLGLVSLAYLWKQDQDLLLQEMISSNIKAILVKVAVLGLHPNEHLGRDLSDLQAHLLHLKELYGINVCGEGGEYETLTLDCPLFKTARIVIDKYELLVHSSDSIAPVGILHPLEFHLEQKSETMITVMTNEGLTMNNSIDYSVIEVEGDTCVSQKSDSPSDALLLAVDVPKMGSLTCTRTANDRFIIHCWIQPSNNCGQGFRNDFSMVLKGIESKLALYQLGWEDVLYIHVYLADMEQFAVANNIYMTYIKEENCPRGVPSRSTVEAPLGGVLGSVYVEVLASEEKSKRVLHVQSISCWAPSCIGPYSQATLHKKVLYMAGQLGLDPPTMALVAGHASAQTVQALINCEAVANAFGCSLGSCLIILTVYCSVSLSSQERSDIHRTVNNFLNDKMASACDSNMTTQEQFHFQPLILYVLVSSLPKRALVEVKPLLCLPIPKRNDLDDEIQERTTLFAQMEVDDDRVCSDSQMTSIYYKSVKLRGRLFACLVTVPMKALDETGYQKSDRITTGASIDYNMRKQTECICYIVRECITVLNKNIRNADLHWKNVLVFRVYFAANAVPMDTMQSAFKESAFSEEDIPTGYFSPSFVPIFGSGMDEKMSDLITCELFASFL